MEQGIVEIMDKQIGQFVDMPEIQSMIRQHMELTRDQAERVRNCIEMLEADLSHVKTGMANVLDAVQGMSIAVAEDKMVKNAMINYAIEYFEIATYQVLVNTARGIGQENIAAICERIIEEEQDMAKRLEQSLPLIARRHLRDVVGKEIE